MQHFLRVWVVRVVRQRGGKFSRTMGSLSPFRCGNDSAMRRLFQGIHSLDMWSGLCGIVNGNGKETGIPLAFLLPRMVRLFEHAWNSASEHKQEWGHFGRTKSLKSSSLAIGHGRKHRANHSERIIRSDCGEWIRCSRGYLIFRKLMAVKSGCVNVEKSSMIRMSVVLKVDYRDRWE